MPRKLHSCLSSACTHFYSSLSSSQFWPQQDYRIPLLFFIIRRLIIINLIYFCVTMRFPCSYDKQFFQFRIHFYLPSMTPRFDGRSDKLAYRELILFVGPNSTLFTGFGGHFRFLFGNICLIMPPMNDCGKMRICSG